MPITDKIRGMRNALIRGKRNAELEFLPAALEVMEVPPSPLGRIISYSIIAFFMLVLLWACLGKIDVVATASGRIVPTSRQKVIQPFETGVVRAIHVRDGQTVKVGDVLIEIDPTINAAEHNRLEQELLQAKLDSARLNAFVNAANADPSKHFMPPQGASPEQKAIQKKLLANQIEEREAKLSAIDEQIAQSGGNKSAVISTIEKLTEAIPLLRKRYAMRRELAEKGYSSKLDALSVQQDLVEHEHELSAQRGRLKEAEGALASLHDQRRQAEAEYLRVALNELAQVEQKISSLREQSIQAEQKYKLQTLTAPVNGTVQQLSVHTEGGVVTPAQALLVIVPNDSKIEIEAMISNRDIGFIHAGQEASIKIDTFNFTKYGLLHGTVESVSTDAVERAKAIDKVNSSQSVGAESDSSEPAGREYIYVARIKIDQTEMLIDDRMVNLIPGMAVSAEIKTGTRRIIEYLLSPLAKHKHSALRER